MRGFLIDFFLDLFTLNDSRPCQPKQIDAISDVKDTYKNSIDFWHTLTHFYGVNLQMGLCKIFKMERFLIDFSASIYSQLHNLLAQWYVVNWRCNFNGFLFEENLLEAIKPNLCERKHPSGPCWVFSVKIFQIYKIN